MGERGLDVGMGEGAMKMGGLFAGIGGFELAAQWAGIAPVWSNEINPFACDVLRKNFEHEIVEEDIRKVDWKNPKYAVDIVCGGFPCQPFSQAGRRDGTEDDRYLWPAMLEVIRAIKPAYVIGENVAGLLTMENGEVLEGILVDLENEGYITETFSIPACSVGAVHRRDRLWIVAYTVCPGTGMEESKSSRQKRRGTKTSKSKVVRQRDWEANAERFNKSNQHGDAPHTHSEGLQGEFREERAEEARRWMDDSNGRHSCTLGWPTVSPVRRADDGLPPELDRAKRLKALGNAIVPQVAYELFTVIKQHYGQTK